MYSPHSRNSPKIKERSNHEYAELPSRIWSCSSPGTLGYLTVTVTHVTNSSRGLKRVEGARDSSIQGSDTVFPAFWPGTTSLTTAAVIDCSTLVVIRTVEDDLCHGPDGVDVWQLRIPEGHWLDKDWRRLEVP